MCIGRTLGTLRLLWIQSPSIQRLLNELSCLPVGSAPSKQPSAESEIPTCQSEEGTERQRGGWNKINEIETQHSGGIHQQLNDHWWYQFKHQ